MTLIVSVDGNIGSGKSTILRILKEKFSMYNNIIFLQEPVDQWEEIKDKNGVTILTKFYENQEKYSFAFQMMAYISRLSLLKETTEKYPNSIIITERCLDTDRHVFAKMLYDSGKIEDIEYQIYLKWFDNFIDDKQTKKIIYLKTDPDICFYRIAKRNRTGESNISIEYLEECHKYHEVMIDETLCEKLIIDGNVDREENNDIVNLWIDQIKNFLSIDESSFSFASAY